MKKLFPEDDPPVIPVIPVTPVTAVTPPPANTITVSSEADWTNALASINAAAPVTAIINVAGSFSVPGFTTEAPNVASGVNLTLTGNGTISLNASGFLLYIRYNTTVTLNGPTLAGNTANTRPLVYVAGSTARFILQSGTITGNTNTYIPGGGVSLNNAVFDMQGGTISGNASNYGGGVYLLGTAAFTMSGGTISGNTAATNGGGVYVGSSNATFEKTGGIIYSDTDANHAADADENTVTSGNMKGHAVYFSLSPTYYRDSTLGAADNLSTADLVTGWNQ